MNTKMICVFLGMALVSIGHASGQVATTDAATYYVSNAGSDRYEGKTPATAWRTLGRVNAASLVPGDAALFRRIESTRQPESSGRLPSGDIIFSDGVVCKPCHLW